MIKALADRAESEKVILELFIPKFYFDLELSEYLF